MGPFASEFSQISLVRRVMAVTVVYLEPLSHINSLLNREITGNFADLNPRNSPAENHIPLVWLDISIRTRNAARK